MVRLLSIYRLRRLRYLVGVFDCFPLSKVKLILVRFKGRCLVLEYLRVVRIDGSEANGIIRDPKLELESSRFTFDLVPLSYESVDVIVGENWLLRHKAEMYQEDERSYLDVEESIVVMSRSCIAGEGAGRFVVYYELGRKDLESMLGNREKVIACTFAGNTEGKVPSGKGNVDVVRGVGKKE
ncbi:hypothetical protein Tco_0857341 [Tanacetum coccineum]|uniref:Uncharacterized protein n=1 Tax=Tanacetum coccineum TaxID=301880 RepID=A0ABQ5BBN9_9ASTR